MQHPLTLGAILVMVACAILLIWWVTDANITARRDLREMRAEKETETDSTSLASHDQEPMESEDDLVLD
jgi:hypothetical protein